MPPENGYVGRLMLSQTAVLNRSFNNNIYLNFSSSENNSSAKIWLDRNTYLQNFLYCIVTITLDNTNKLYNAHPSKGISPVIICCTWFLFFWPKMEMESAVHSVWEIVVTLTKCIEHKNSHGVIQKSERQHPFTTDVLAAVLDLQAAQGCRLVSITILAMLQLIWVFIIPPMAGDVADVIPQQTPDPLVSVAVRWI